MDHPDASVLIVTKDRRDAVGAAVRSALEQDGNIEVIVIDDGSTDGTSQLIRSEFPEARLERSERSLGCVEQRNRGVRLAGAPVVLSLDDDAVFDHPRVAQQTLHEFSDPRIAAVHIPLLDGPRPSGLRAIASFVGWAHALRRTAFLDAGGYQGALIGQGEERDLCIRWLQQGMIVVQGQVGGVTHRPYPTRDWSPVARLARRNDVIHLWQNVPFPYAVPHLIGTLLNGFRIGVRHHVLLDQLVGFGTGMRKCMAREWPRRPMRRETYKLYRALGKPGGVAMAEALEQAGRRYREASAIARESDHASSTSER
jgi:glycosyltransferase involved in cell wall biosynthesis